MNASILFGGFIVLVILAIPVVAFLVAARWTNARQTRLAPVAYKEQIKHEVLRGMYDKEVQREVLTEIMADGAVQIDQELKVRRVLQQMRERE